MLLIKKLLLSAAHLFWSMANNTFHFHFGMMDPTIYDIFALLGLPPLGAEANTLLIYTEASYTFSNRCAE